MTYDDALRDLMILISRVRAKNLPDHDAEMLLAGYRLSVDTVTWPKEDRQEFHTAVIEMIRGF